MKWLYTLLGSKNQACTIISGTENEAARVPDSGT
jgi:hypothetical protein